MSSLRLGSPTAWRERPTKLDALVSSLTCGRFTGSPGRVGYRVRELALPRRELGVAFAETRAAKRDISPTRAALRRGMIAAATAVVGAGLLVSAALADATPVQLVLLYLPNISTTGT